MDYSVAERIVEDHLAEYQAALRLNHWHIVVVFETIEDHAPRRDCDARTAGRSSCNPAYEHARISLDPSEIEDEARLLQILRHELFHVVLSPFDLYRDFATALITANTPTDTQEDGIWHYVVEQGVICLERMWNGIAERNTLRVAQEQRPMAKKKSLPPEFVKHMGRMQGDGPPKAPKAVPRSKGSKTKKGG